MRFSLKQCPAAAVVVAGVVLTGLVGCQTFKISYEPPSTAHQPQTSLDPLIKSRLREAALAGSEDQLALTAITLAGEKAASAADIAAYAAELQPASAQFIAQAMSDMYPDEADQIERAVTAAIPTSEAAVAPSHATGHTFFYWH
ncbi:MAG: hypothetical protein ACOYOL_10115 [Chthoniobacterales bacterium]